MNEATVLRDMNKSLSYVNEKISPILGVLLPGWHLEAIEGNDNDVCRMLDMSCGIDYLLYSSNSSLIFGLASRVQYDENYRTFTVRKERESGAITEGEKRSFAILHGGLYPYYQMQAYIVSDKVAGLAITKTADLLDFIAHGLAKEKRTNIDKIGQASFYVCDWDKMRSCGYKVLEYKEGE